MNSVPPFAKFNYANIFSILGGKKLERTAVLAGEKDHSRMYSVPARRRGHLLRRRTVCGRRGKCAIFSGFARAVSRRGPILEYYNVKMLTFYYKNTSSIYIEQWMAVKLHEWVRQGRAC